MPESQTPKIRSLKVPRVEDPERLRVLKYEESLTLKDSESEVCQSPRLPKTPSLKYVRVCTKGRLGIIKCVESAFPKDSEGSAASALNR